MPDLPPNRVVDRSKIESYLLHRINGRGKAAFFEAYGFSLARWDELRSAWQADHDMVGVRLITAYPD